MDRLDLKYFVGIILSLTLVVLGLGLMMHGACSV
jgi:hypothetical protein